MQFQLLMSLKSEPEKARAETPSMMSWEWGEEGREETQCSASGNDQSNFLCNFHISLKTKMIGLPCKQQRR